MNVRDLFSETPSGLGFSLRREEVSEYFKIDGETRVITPPTDFKNFGVESDQNSKRAWFESPKIVGDNIDLSTLNLYINYKNANGEVDKYYVDDVEVVDDKIYFSWKLERKPVRYKGTLTFIMCAVATNSEGIKETEWNTTLCTGQVLEGLEVEAPEIPEEESDLINQLIDLVKDTSSKAVADVEAAKEEAIASIGIAGSPLFANALKATASGEVVRVDDVSPLGHMAKVKVNPTTETITRYGKNILNFTPYTTNNEGATTKTFDAPILPVGATVYISGYFSDGVALASGNSAFVFRKGSTQLLNVSPNTSIVITEELATADTLAIYTNATVAGKRVEAFQLEVGSKGTDYEEYKTPQTFTPDASGYVDIPPLSPTMTLLTDTAGVNIDLEYNKDINVTLGVLMEVINSIYAKSLVRTVSVSLLASKWVETDGVYSQLLTIEGVTPYSKVDLQPSVEQLAIFYEKDVSFVTENDNGTITVFCIGQKPMNDYVMQATITEVENDG